MMFAKRFKVNKIKEKIFIKGAENFSTIISKQKQKKK